MDKPHRRCWCWDHAVERPHQFSDQVNDEVRLHQVRPAEVCALKAGTAEVRPDEERPGEVSLAHVRSAEVRLTEFRILEVCLSEVCPLEVWTMSGSLRAMRSTRQHPP
jgi:hypothetical protein